MNRDDAIKLAGRAGFHVATDKLPGNQVRRIVSTKGLFCTGEVLQLVELAQTEERKRLNALQMRNMLRAMQAGEMTVSRGVELIDMWLAGNYSDEQLPPVRDLGLGEDDIPADVILQLRTEKESAVAAEREACAAIAQSFDNGSDDLQRGSDGGAIADKIRARGKA